MGIYQWLYRDGRPNWMARLMNNAWAFLHARGIAPGYLVTLEVPGHKTGASIKLPLVMVQSANDRFLVSMLGQRANWVRNVTAAQGYATLWHGRREAVRLVPVPIQQCAPIIKLFVQKAPGARAHIPVAPNAPLTDFEQITGQYPVFRVEPDQRDHPDTMAA